MKTIITLLICCGFSSGIYAQDTIPRTKESVDSEYCASYRKGRTVMLLNGKPLTTEVTLSNGTKVTMNGNIIRKDGSNKLLKNGECIDKNDVISDKSKTEGMRP